jgi:CBS domain-containing protein
MLVGTILQHKGSAVVGVSPLDSILSVARTLSENRIGAALVRDPDGAVLGIISERDIVRGMAAHGPGTTGLQAALDAATLEHGPHLTIPGASNVHDFADSPSTWMVHAPHDEVSQPMLVPVRPSSSRRK